MDYLKQSNIDPLLHLKKEISEAARSLHEDNLIAFGITNHEFERYKQGFLHPVAAGIT